MILWVCTMSPPAEARKVERELDELLDAPALAGATVSIRVEREDGRLLYARDADKRVVPASTAKWVTAVAAAERLGLDWRFTTTVAATGWTEGDTLHGDLVVVGGGDPTLGDPEPAELLELVVAAVRDGGLARIDGAVVADPRWWPGEGLGPGWMWDDLGLAYAAPPGPLLLAHGLQAPALAHCPARGGPGSPLVDPAGCVAGWLVRGLADAGIEVTGGSRVAWTPEAVPLADHTSAPLRDVMRQMLVHSDNLYAEAVRGALDPWPPSEPSVRADEVAKVWAAAGVPLDQVRLVDGSGLSRYSSLSADALVAVTTWAAARPYGPELIGLLPVSGRDGTLAGRTVGTAAEGRVHAKTGSMTGVRNLVGTVTAADGEQLRFAFLIDGLVAPQKEAIALQDRALAILAISRRGRVRRADRQDGAGSGG